MKLVCLFAATLSLFATLAGAQVTSETRAMWVSRFEWPSSNRTTAQNNINNIMATAKANRFNTVLFQVRGQMDVHYPSPYEPWSNTYGWSNPGWDPLAYAIQKAHENGLEFHAYINTHTMAQPIPPAQTTPQHMYNLHGPNVPLAQSWLIRDSNGQTLTSDNYHWVSPGIPEASWWTRRAILHVVQNYDVDGIHFDRIRTPGSQFSRDPISMARMAGDGNPDGLAFNDFMRSQITRDLRNIYGEVMLYKPHVKMSAAPFGIVFRDPTTHYQGSGTQSYHVWHQDSWTWMQSHVLDFMVPQIYWQVGSSHPFELLLKDWLERSGDRLVVAGSTTNGGTKSVSALLAEHAETRSQGAAGHCIFSWSSLSNYLTSFRTQRYTSDVPVSPMPWKTAPTTGYIVGRVKDMQGNPVLDAKVNLAGDSYNYLSAYDGFFAILDVPPGTTHAISAIKPSAGRAQVANITVTPGGVTEVELIMSQSAGYISLDRGIYKDGDTIRITLTDSDLAGSSIVPVIIDSTIESSGETVNLAEQSPGVFSGSIVLAEGAVVEDDGILQASYGNVLTVYYRDANNGFGSAVDLTDTAIADFRPPTIHNVSVSNITSFAALVYFQSSSLSSAAVEYGPACGVFTDRKTNETSATTHQVQLTGLVPGSTYYFRVLATETAGNVGVGDNNGQCYTFTTPVFTQPDFFTELFSASDNDMDFSSVTFRPNGSINHYAVCREPASAFGVTTQTALTRFLSDDSFATITLPPGKTVSLYGTQYNAFHIGSNGYITFGSGDFDYVESTSEHFSLPRISMHFDDLDPSGRPIYYEILSDKVVVTYNTPQFSNADSNQFQLEMFFDGTIRITYLRMDASDGLVGLSPGGGTPVGFVESNFSNYSPCDPPDAPLNLDASTVSQTEIQLSWIDAALGETTYTVERRTESTGFGPIAHLAPNTSSYVDADLAADTVYFYRVSASNVWGSAPSNEDSARTLPYPPQGPTQLNATAVSAYQINITWSDESDNETTFVLERRLSAGGTFAPLATLAANIESHNDLTAQPDTQYDYRVIAQNAGGSSGYSNEDSARTLPLPPQTPLQLTATPITPYRVDLLWSDESNNETAFILERKVAGGSVFAPIATLPPNAEFHTDNTAQPATSYVYRVYATNTGGSSSYSNEATAQTLPLPPQPPTQLTAVAVTPYRVDLTWSDESNNETGFVLERRVAGGGAFVPIATPPANAESYSDLTAQPAAEYIYRILAQNTGGASPYSNEASAQTLPLPPQAPTNLAAVAISQWQADLTWNDESHNETTFILERAAAGGSWLFLAALPADSESYSDTTTVPETEYQYRVYAQNAGGSSGYSNTAMATTPPPAGTLLLQLQNPNPARGGGKFGYAVAGLGSSYAVSAPFDDTGARDSGVVYFYEQAGALLKTVSNPEPALGDAFGFALAAGDGLLAVGVPFDDAGRARNAGSVFLFDSAGTLIRKIANPAPAAEDRFGWSVCIRSGKLFVGAPGEDAAASNSGAIYIFDLATGVLLEMKTNPSAGLGDQFGFSVAADNGLVCVGAALGDTGGTNAGAAYIFDFDTLELLKTVNGGAAQDWLGFAVAVDTDGNVCTGAPVSNSPAPATVQFQRERATGASAIGGVVVFVGEASNTQVLNPTPAARDGFGFATAAYDLGFATSAIGDDGKASDCGVVYMWNADGTSRGRLEHPAPAQQDYFGWSVGSNVDQVIVGCPNKDASRRVRDTGAVYVFQGL